MDMFSAVLLGLILVPISGTLLGMYDTHRTLHPPVDPCPACRHPEHWPWCRECGCDLFTEPED